MLVVRTPRGRVQHWVTSARALPLLDADLARFSAPQLDSGLVLSKTDKSRDSGLSFHTCCCILPLLTACLHLVVLTRALPLPLGVTFSVVTLPSLYVLRCPVKLLGAVLVSS